MVGSKIGEAVSENFEIKEQIKEIERIVKNHPYSEPQIDRIPTPDSSLIPSMLENGDENIPLIKLLESLEILNVLEILLIIALIILLFNKNIFNMNIKIISYILNKYIPIKYHNKINTILNKGKEYNKKQINIFIVLIIILLLILKLENLYISLELNNNIADYVLVYNFVKKQSLFYILAFNKKNY